MLDTFYDGRAKSSLLIGTYPFPIVFSPALKRKAFGWLAELAYHLGYPSFCFYSSMAGGEKSTSTRFHSVLYCLIKETEWTAVHTHNDIEFIMLSSKREIENQIKPECDAFQ